MIDLDLFLYDVTEPEALQVVAESAKPGGNSENIWIKLKNHRKYMLQVKPAQGKTGFTWDYALAWRIE